MYLLYMSFFFYSQLICTGFVSFQKLHGNRHKNNHQHSRKSKSHKRKRRDCPSSLSLTESYSPTIPTSRRDDDSQSNTLGTSIESQKSPEREQESFFQDQEPDLNQSPTVFTQSYEPYEYMQKEPMQGPSYCSSPRAHNFFPLDQATITPPAAILPDMGPEPIPPPDVVTYPPLFDPQPSRQSISPPYTPSTYGEYELTPVPGSIIYPILLSTWMQACVSYLFLIWSTSLGWYS